MPRYRFQWDTVPAPLLRRLARELDLTADAVVALGGIYGKRPGPEFVRDCWPTLRAAWLARSTGARRQVVDELRDRALGDTDLPVRNREQQLAYLASCRNSSSLREVVLAAFLALGDRPAQIAPPVTVPATPAGRRATRPSRVEPAGGAGGPEESVDLDAETEAAWAEFATRLAAAMKERRVPILVDLPPLRPLEHGSELHVPQVWFFPQEHPDLRAEVGVEFAEDDLANYLEPGHLQALAERGWHLIRNHAGFEATAQYTSTPSPAPAALLARHAVRMIREVFGVLHPSFLTPYGFWDDKDTELERIEAGAVGDVDPAGPGGGYCADPEDRFIVYDIRDGEHLRELVDIALTPVFDGPPVHDEDDDIPVRVGPLGYYIRVADGSPFIQIFAPLAHGVDGSARTMKRLNKLNQRFRALRFTWQGGVVTAAMDVPCWPFVPAQLRDAMTGMAALAAHLDDVHDRLGGVPF